jgi:hypothetical protein
MGDPMPAASIDEAMKGISDMLGTGASENPDQAGDAGAGANPDAAGDAAPESDAPPENSDAEAYRARQGTRPKKAPKWDEYTSGGNPLAK